MILVITLGYSLRIVNAHPFLTKLFTSCDDHLSYDINNSGAINSRLFIVAVSEVKITKNHLQSTYHSL